MKYNLYIKTQSTTYNILDIDDDKLATVVDAYKYGKGSFFNSGKKCLLSNLIEIQIYTFESEKFKTGRQLLEFCEKNKVIERGYFKTSSCIPPKVLDRLGKIVTDKFIVDDYGYLSDSRIDGISSELFVDLSRIDELNKINNPRFDFTKLLGFLKELNLAYANNMFLTIPILIRSIIDHVPPIFNKNNFSDLSGSYGNRSFKDSMRNLDNSSRKIADSFLHVQIRNHESLPTKTQVNFKHDLDVLLQEIVRINKK